MFGISLLIALGIVGIISLLWLRPNRAKCPDCGSHKVTMINQSVEKVTPYDLVSGEGGGKMLMMDIKETFRCSQCETVWVRERQEA